VTLVAGCGTIRSVNQADASRRRFLAGAAGVGAALGFGSRDAAGQPSPVAGSRTLELPGFVDLQVNGFAGVDFGDPATTPDEVRHAVAAIEKTGVTRFLPTLITSSLEAFVACARALVRAGHPAIVGIHMEGPYISPEDGPRGAHAREHVRGADVEDFRRRQDAADGRIRLVTLAPEAPGAVALVEHLVAAGVRVAIGHTAANRAQIQDAVAAGATLSTHLGNGCAGTLPRHPNLLWEQLAEDRLLASLIVDGHHLPEATVRSMIRAKTPARTILVTDAMAAAGMPPGVYTIGRQRVELDATGRVAAPGASNLAGSALLLPVAIGNTVRFTGLSLEDVIPMATTRPAEYIGIRTAGTVVAEWDADAFSLCVLRVGGFGHAPGSPGESGRRPSMAQSRSFTRKIARPRE
jgi:N-acetylglucosamine-6-phosphate deacetylase